MDTVYVLKDSNNEEILNVYPLSGEAELPNIDEKILEKVPEMHYCQCHINEREKHILEEIEEGKRSWDDMIISIYDFSEGRKGKKMNTVYTLMDTYENQLIDIFENKYKAVLGARDYILYMVRKGKWDAWEKEIAILESTNTMAIERVITESYPFLVIKGRMVI